MPLQLAGRRLNRAWTLFGVTVVLVVLSLVIGWTGGETWSAVFGTIPVALAFALVGALVAARTGNRLGWLFLAAGTATAVTILTNVYAARSATAELPGAAWAGWIFTVALGIVAPLFYLALLLFPDGRLLSPRWRPVLWVAIISGLAEMACSALSDVNFSSNFPHLRDPVTVVAPLGTAFNLAEVAGTLVLPAAAVALIVRFRRSGQEQRLQLKWFMYAVAVAALAVFAASQLSSNPLTAWEISLLLIPAAVGIAILKYRLYEIDRLISRTLAYALVTGLLIGVYAGLVIVATQVFRFKTPVAVAVATLAAAALFSPLRRRVQRMVDRRFNRVRYDADQTVAAFAGRLRDAVDLDTVRADLLAVVTNAVEPAQIAVWIAGDGQKPST